MNLNVMLWETLLINNKNFQQIVCHCSITLITQTRKDEADREVLSFIYKSTNEL